MSDDEVWDAQHRFVVQDLPNGTGASDHAFQVRDGYASYFPKNLLCA